MNSRLYRGHVWHSRGEPRYTFRYRVWYLCLDLAEVDALARTLRLFSRNRFNVTALWDRDYAALDGAASVSGQHASDDRQELITLPRILGYAFNPVSFLLHRRPGTVASIHAEVHNTWGDRHVYALENDGPDGDYGASAPKAFYVSPFLPADGNYRFHLREEEDGQLVIQIDLGGENGEKLLSGGIDVKPLPLSDANLARLLVAMPFVNLKTVAMIHWQGFKLWLRGVPFRANPNRSRTRRRQLWPTGH